MAKSRNKKFIRLKKEQSGRHVRKNLIALKERKENKNAVWRKEEERQTQG